MTNDELNKKIAEYLKENLRITLHSDDFYGYDRNIKNSVTVKLWLGEELIDSSSI